MDKLLEKIQVEDVFDLVLNKLETWLKTILEMLPNFVIAVLILILFWIIAKVLRKITGKLLARTSASDSLINLGSTTIYFLVLVAGTFVALSILHLDKTVTSLLAGVGVIGLALGFAFQDIIANFVSGILIAIRKPLRIGHQVDTNGYSGVVQEVNLRSTIIRTFQGQDVIIPNKDIFQNPLTNYARYPKRRIDLEVGVSYGDDLKKVMEIAINAIKNINLLDQTEEVELYYSEFGASSINFVVMYWVDQHTQARFLEARSEGVMKIKQAFDDNGITIPFPIRTLDFGIKGGEKISEMGLCKDS